LIVTLVIIICKNSIGFVIVATIIMIFMGGFNTLDRNGKSEAMNSNNHYKTQSWGIDFSISFSMLPEVRQL